MSAPRRVLIVCYGNLCRSPMAEGLLRARLPAAGWEVASAGTHAFDGAPPTVEARDTVLELDGVDISEQRSRALSEELIRDADYIFTMSRSQAGEITRFVPGAASRTWLLGAFSPAPEAEGLYTEPGGAVAHADEIGDPMGADPATYRACYRRIAEAVDAVAAWLLRPAERPAPEPASAWLSEDDRPVRDRA